VLTWTTTTIAGAEHYSAKLPDGRYAFVAPSSRPGKWLARVVRKPGQIVADVYQLCSSAEAARAWVERRMAARRVA
jgi:hypothetical protein